MFSSLPKMADKNFVLGFLLPMLLATLAGLHLLKDVEPFASTYAGALEQKNASELTLLVVTIWVLAALLLLFNHQLYRTLEGYIGPFNRERWRARMRSQLETEQQKLKELAKQINMPEADQRKSQLDADEGKPKILAMPPEPSESGVRAYYNLWRLHLERFPDKPQLVLPTRFGNVIRSFEVYADYVYGVDSIPAWLRLQGVIPKEFQAAINDARSLVDFCLNTWLLGIAIATLALVRCVLEVPAVVRGEGFELTYVAAVCFAAIVVLLAYEGAIARAQIWGGLVKSAFDLYLPALAKQMGYDLPKTEAERKAFWSAATSMFLYWDPIDPAAWPRASLTKGETGHSAGGAASNEDKDEETADDDKSG